MDEVQVQQLVQTWRDQLEKQMGEMKLRQWCVEQSIKYATAGVKYDPIILLQFITAPFAETFKDSEKP